MTRRILRVITRLNVGGPATHVLLADEGLRSRGWETLLVHGQIEPDETEVDLSASTIPRRSLPALVRPIRPTVDARAVAQLVRIIRSYRPAVIHTHLSKAGVVGRLAALASSRAVRVHTFHGTVFADYFGRRTSRTIARTERFLGHRTHAILALSERQKAELVAEQICPVDRIRVVPLGLDLARFAERDRAAARRSLGIAGDDKLVVSIGRHVPIKRLDRLLDAFVTVVARTSAARLVLVGGGSERAALERRSIELGIADHVTFAGWSADTPNWYAAADVIALTSDREGTPLALIEAAAASRPVVATDVGGVADIVEDGVTGFIVPRGDTASLADRLTRLLTDASLRDRMGAAAPVRASGWSADRLVADLDATYRDLLAAKP